MQDVIKKFKFKDKGVVFNAPLSIEKEFEVLGFKIAFDEKIQSKNTLIFINNQAEYLKFLKSKLKNVEPDGVLWFAYPKGSSKVKTDINRDSIRATGEKFGITTVAAISIDEIWTALRFRPIHLVLRIDKKQSK